MGFTQIWGSFEVLGFLGGKMASFKDLEVWMRGIDLVEDVYSLTAKFPANEQFGLVSQMRKGRPKLEKGVESWSLISSIIKQRRK